MEARNKWWRTTLPLILAAILLAAGLVASAVPSLPGSPLYGVKRASEGAWLWLAPWNQKGAAHLHLAGRRLHEFLLLFERGSFDQATLARLGRHGDAALAYADTMPPNLAARLLDEVVTSAARCESALTGVHGMAYGVQRLAIEQALEGCEQQAGAALARASILESGFVPGVPTAGPTQTAVVNALQAATRRAPTQGRTPTIEATSSVRPAAAATRSAAATSTWRATATRSATPMVTATAGARATATASGTPSATATATARPPAAPTTLPSSTPVSTPTSAPAPTNTPLPTHTPLPTPVPTHTPQPTPVPTHTPQPTLVPTHTSQPTPVPTNTPQPTPVPTNTPQPTPLPTDTPAPTNTPDPTNTQRPEPTPKPTNTPKPTKTPKPTNTPRPGG